MLFFEILKAILVPGFLNSSGKLLASNVSVLDTGKISRYVEIGEGELIHSKKLKTMLAEALHAFRQVENK